jgi:hypothetical protein
VLAERQKLQGDPWNVRWKPQADFIVSRPAIAGSGNRRRSRRRMVRRAATRQDHRSIVDTKPGARRKVVVQPVPDILELIWLRSFFGKKIWWNSISSARSALDNR